MSFTRHLQKRESLKFIANKNQNINVSNELIDFVNLPEKGKLFHTKPEKLSINNDEFICSSWKDVIIDVCSFLYKKYGEEFIKKIPHNDISINKTTLISPRQIPNTKYWIETNLSSESIFAKSRDLLQKLNVPLEKVKLYLNIKNSI